MMKIFLVTLISFLGLGCDDAKLKVKKRPLPINEVKNNLIKELGEYYYIKYDIRFKGIIRDNLVRQCKLFEYKNNPLMVSFSYRNKGIGLGGEGYFIVNKETSKVIHKCGFK